MNDITQGGTLLIVLNGLGLAIKKVPQLPDWSIPFVLAVAGAVGHCAIESVWTGANAVQGIAIGLASVGLNQMFRQGVGAVKSNTTTITKP
jgi:hypothetical protein